MQTAKPIPMNKPLPSRTAAAVGEKNLTIPNTAIAILSAPMTKLMVREIAIACASARCMARPTHQPFTPSAIIIPAMNTKPSVTANIHPDIFDAAKENKAAWLIVSNESANAAPTVAINTG